MIASDRQPRIDWVFLDRDGTINVKAPAGDYIKSPADLELLPGAAQAIRSLNDAGIWVGVVTNQRGIGLGQMSIADLERVHVAMTEKLKRAGAHIDAYYYCPHEQNTCDCRKPEPGMLLNARSAIPEISFDQAMIVGDSLSDVEAGRRAGVITVLLTSDARLANAARPDYVAESLEEAVNWLLMGTPTLAPVRPEPA